jgi:hypothetical protein
VSSRIENLEVTQETARLIRDNAEAEGMTIESYLRAVLEGSQNPASRDKMTLAQIDEVLNELAAGGQNLSPLPENFSREDIYLDHD